MVAARRDAAALVEGGADAILVENFHDAPFYKSRVPRMTVAAMTAAAIEVRSAAPGLPVGVNVLRNDGRAALAVAVAAGCHFIRVNVLSGARVTDQGIIQGISARLLRDRRMLGCAGATAPGCISIWADVDVKHSAPLAPRPLEEEVADMLERGGADALIVTGAGTGRPTDPGKLARVKAVAGTTPVLVGSGVTLKALEALREHADGLIVGTTLKGRGQIDIERVRQVAQALRRQ